VLIGEDGRFWMLTNLGVFAVAREELNRIADGGMGPLIGSLYGVADGMPSSEANGGNQYAGTKASDGKLWFPMLRDVVIIDPNRVSRIPPRVFIERASSLTADNQNTSAAQADLLAGVTIANDARNLQIEYTGLSFSKPAAIRFLYKLDGLDHDWTDAGDRRTAFYPYLPAGNYTFLVRVVSGDGVWSESAAGLRIKVAARFWETVTFRILVALGLVAIGALIYRLRVRQLEAHHERQRDFARRLIDAHETERMRLAKDLHDGLGQQLLLIKNFASLGLSRKSVAGSSDSYFEKISGAASDSIEETRAIVNELGPQNLRRFGLTEAIANMAHDVEAASGVTFEKHIANIDDLLSQESELSVFRVVQECLNNVVKHSQSSRAQINVNQVGRRIKIAVRDFGAGFSTDDVLGRRTGRAGFGFQSISERVDLLGGKVDITSKPGQGTCVAIEIAIENAEPNHSPGS
jgi:signal transduction histidine kinase